MIKCKIVTPDGLYKETLSSIINVGTIDGQRGILPKHMPIVLVLDISRMTLVENDKRQHYAIGGGMLYFADDEATILVNAIESQDDIDVDRAHRAKDRAEGRLDKNDPNNDIRRAEVALKRAINRINVKSYK